MEPLGPPQEEVQSLTRLVQVPAIQKPSLQRICSVNGLGKTGNKAELQRRIIALVNECAAKKDLQRFSEIKQSVLAHASLPLGSAVTRQQQSPSSSVSSSFTTPENRTTSSKTVANSSPYQPNHNMAHRPDRPYAPYETPYLSHSRMPYSQSFDYKQSPFHEFQYRIGDVRTCEMFPNNRNAIAFHIKAQDHALLQKVPQDPELRVMVFCAGERTGVQDVAFPQNCELKINGSEVKANMRGLKNKPGTTRPVDITGLMRLRPVSFNNQVEFTYALTQKPFYLGIYICKTPSVDFLVSKITKKISKSQVVREITHVANDPDLQATSQKMSLKCPTSYMRLVTPCRSTSCTHIQCFDATSYLLMQQQAEQWLCPICYKKAPYHQLAIDEYVSDILSRTHQDIEQVTIEPDGRWLVPGSNGHQSAANLSNDDEVVISEVGYSQSSRNVATPSRSSGVGIGTPMTQTSRESSSMPRSGGGAGTKRRAAEVIDLTLSDDDEPPRQRPRLGNSSAGGGNRSHWNGTY